MNLQQTVLGIVLFIVFWGFQNGYANSLGTSAWFAGSIIFVIILWLIGKSSMSKPSAEMKELWMFTIAFAIVTTFIVSYLGPYFGVVFPANFTPAMLTPLVLSIWLIVFGGAMLITGWQSKMGVTTLIGIIWLFSALHFVTAVSTGPNSYLHFGLITGLPYILSGLLAKK